MKLFFAAIVSLVLNFVAMAINNPYGYCEEIESDAIYLINTDTNTVVYSKNICDII